jgi:hypothetical protein
MIVKIMSRGKSFTGAATYLTHDPQANTAERVGWTHTHNLANDDVPCAVNEMLWTARDAELLKQDAGVRAGGRAMEDPVKHLSINWSPEDRPSRQHMIETTEKFLSHMNWQEHQAVFISHTDKKYAHVHVLLNVVHPETGLCLDEGFERRRAQEWALQYELEHDRVYCEQRLKNPEERDNNPPRNIWMAFQQNQIEFENAEKSLGKNGGFSPGEPINQNNAEWKILKEIQRTERIDFFAEGKSEFKELRNSIYQEIRDEFRGRWADYYEARKSGADPDALTQIKAELVDEQKAVLEARRDAACAELRASRDGRYRELLDDQREFRAHLHSCQEAGLDNMPMLLSLQGRDATQDISAAFREAAEETTRHAGDESGGRSVAARDEDSSARGGDGTVVDLGLGAAKAFDSLLSIFEGTRAPSPSRPVDMGSFESAAREALKREHEREDAEAREKHRAFYGE